MAKTIEEIYNELIDHLEFSIEHGGFEIGPTATGGCSCEICSYLRGYSAVKFYMENGKWPI